MAMGVLGSYAEYLPLTSDTPLLSLGEGSTPLVRSVSIGPELGIPELYFKLEGCNPTGSFKDRGMVLAVAKAVEQGYETILCASTGNTSAAAAAYAAARASADRRRPNAQADQAQDERRAQAVVQAEEV